MRFTLLIGSLLVSFWMKAQVDYETLGNIYFPTELKGVIEEALSFYPDLEDTHIDFVFKKRHSSAFMEARPALDFIITPKMFRSYYIYITREIIIGKDSMYIGDVPHEVLLGWIGHELGHVRDYEDRSSLNLIFYGLGYALIPSHKRKVEYRADLKAVGHGLGKEIIATKDFILKEADLPLYYKRKIKRYYLSPEQIREEVTRLETEREENRKKQEKIEKRELKKAQKKSGS